MERCTFICAYQVSQLQGVRLFKLYRGYFHLLLKKTGEVRLIKKGFVPVYVLLDWLRGFGEWTPNGLALAAYTDWVQQSILPELYRLMGLLLLFSLLAIIVGIALFPRKCGTHAELLAKHGVYESLLQTQIQISQWA